MSDPTQPPFPSDPSVPYQAAADEYVSVMPDEEEAEEDDDETSSGDAGGDKDRRKYKVVLDPLLNFSDEEGLSDDENAVRKLKKLGLSPMSFLVSGASGFASENDLSRKVFMADVGLVNKEISPRDIANPQLFKALDGRQAERRALFGIKTLDEIVTGAIGAAGAVIGLVSASVKDFVQDKKEARKAEKIAFNSESGIEEYALDSLDEADSRKSLETTDFPVQDDQGAELIEAERDRLYDEISEASPLAKVALTVPVGAVTDGRMTLSDAFRILADISLQAMDSIQTVRLSEDMGFGADGQIFNKSFTPTGD